MTWINPDAEETLERDTLALFAELDWETVNAYHETYTEAPDVSGGGPSLGRATRGQVILRPRLEAALARLNPTLPPEALQQAIAELTRDRSAMTLVQANREVYKLLKDGVQVSYRDAGGEERFERVRVVDWAEPSNNDFLLVQQFWGTGEVYTRRADLVGFVNGLPLLFGELKAHHRRVEDAYHRNLSDYKDTIPHLLWYNAFILLSNGSDARLGTITSEWEHFSTWKKINSEGEQGVISLETLVRATCQPARFLDIAENYLLYQERRGGLAKIVAKYHQYFGVENAIEAVRHIQENQGQLGVFWHTQGSGKSISMIFFSQKVLRKLPGNWTFVIITDRVDLDDQIYKYFEEDQRAIAENLSEEELAVFDILTRPDLNLTEKEKRAVKQVAHDLLETLKREKLVLDWRKRQQSRAAVRVLIEDMIWQLPERYTEKMCQQKSAQIYQHIYDNYWGPERSIYAMAA